MEIKSKHFAPNLNTECSKIPSSILSEVVIELSVHAKFNMTALDVSSVDLVRMSETIIFLLSKGKYKHLPLRYVSEAFMLGSLGELGGTTKFNARTVNIWLGAIDEKCRKIVQDKYSKVDDDRKKEEERAFKAIQAKSSIYGRALYWKISQTPLPDPVYDQLNLDRIVAAFQSGISARDLTVKEVLNRF